jgi:lipoprotein-anchoring transpeptidase ErfK/SrfK
LHSNYWTPPDQFGAFGTHGCVGLLKADAAWFWQFLSLTSMVTIHR